MSEPNIAEAFQKPVGGYGRIFESMYSGSMIGQGLEVFALMPYVISSMRGHPEHGALVELNPKLLAFTFGCSEAHIRLGIDKLCAKDGRSRNKKEDGRKLVKMGEYLYRVVNGAEYMAIRKAEANRLAHAHAQRKYRENKKVNQKPSQKQDWELPIAVVALVEEEAKDRRRQELDAQPADEELAALREQERARAEAERNGD